LLLSAGMISQEAAVFFGLHCHSSFKGCAPLRKAVGNFFEWPLLAFECDPKQQ
jgi:hypothetical protein